MRYLKEKISIQFNTFFLYKFDNLLGAVTIFLPICVFQFIWLNIGSIDAEQQDLATMQIYSLLSMGIYSLYGNSIIETMAAKMVNGDIVFEFVKPISFVAECFVNDIGRIVAELIFHFVPVSFFSILFFTIPIGKIGFELKNILMFFLILISGYFIMFQLCFLTSLFSAWITNIYNCRYMINQIIRVLSGSIIPLWILPDSIQAIIYKTPFPYIISAPISFLLYNESESFFKRIVYIQVLWLIVLFAMNMVVYKKFKKKLFILGG